jgi:hypothetical protein
MRRSALGAALGLFLLSGIACDEMASGSGKFAFDSPPGWTKQPFGGLKHDVVMGPAANGFTPNINIVEERFRGSIDAYVQGSIDSMNRMLQNAQILAQSEFTTTDGLEGRRMTIENDQFGHRLRQTFYFFEQGSQKFVVTCSALAEGGEELDPVFETSMKTFHFEP